MVLVVAGGEVVVDFGSACADGGEVTAVIVAGVVVVVVVAVVCGRGLGGSGSENVCVGAALLFAPSAPTNLIQTFANHNFLNSILFDVKYCYF